MKSKHDKHWRRTLKAGGCNCYNCGRGGPGILCGSPGLAVHCYTRDCGSWVPSRSNAAVGRKTDFGAVSAKTLDRWKREQTSGDEFVARLGKAFGAPRPGGEFVAFVHPTQEPDLLGQDGSLTKMHTWPTKVVLPDMKALLVSLAPEACSG